jgi:hypothetical protein
VARYCDGPHAEHARWRTKAERWASGVTTNAWCDQCKATELARPDTRFKDQDFEQIPRPVDRKEVDL